MDYQPMAMECAYSFSPISAFTKDQQSGDPENFVLCKTECNSQTDNNVCTRNQTTAPATNLSARSPFEQFSGILEAYVLRYPRDPGKLHGKPVHAYSRPIQLPHSEIERVWVQYFSLRKLRLPNNIAHSLTSHKFNNWLYSDAQLLICMRHMFLNLDLPVSCGIPVDVLETWLLAVYRRYNNVPFHNFKHAFMVTQMMYCLIKQAQLVRCFSSLDLLVLMFSAVSHDLDHPGFTNSYQVSTSSWLSIRYNDCSPLENHHCAVAFDLISHPSTNIACGLQPSDWRWFRKAVIKCILATDMATHNDHINRFRLLIAQLKLVSTGTHGSNLRRLFETDPDNRLSVMSILLKTCDISNELRPIAVSDPWLDRLLEEFFYQANAEKRVGLPVASFMDPDKVVRTSSQVNFLLEILIPLLKCVSAVFPDLEPLEMVAKDRVSYYSQLTRQQDEEELESANSPVHLTPHVGNFSNDTLPNAVLHSRFASSDSDIAVRSSQASREKYPKTISKSLTMCSTSTPRVHLSNEEIPRECILD